MSDSPVVHPLETRPPQPAGRLVPAQPVANRRLADSQPADDEGLQLSILWNALARWWRLILPASLVIAAGGSLLSFRLFVPKYRATAYLQIDETPKYVVAAKPEDVSRRFLYTQVELIRSPLVLISALSDPQLAQMPELARRKSPWEWLAKKKLEVTPLNESELLMVAYEGPDPAMSARLVDGIVNAYLHHLDGEQERQDNYLIQALEEEQREQEAKLKQMEDEIRQLRKELPGDSVTLPSRREIVLTDNPLKELQDQLNGSEMGLIELEAKIRATQELIDQPSFEVGQSIIDAQVDQDPFVGATLVELERLRTKMDQIAKVSRLGNQDPQYRRHASTIQQLEARVQEIRQEVRPRVEQQIAAASRQHFEMELIELRRQRDVQQARIQQLAEKIDQQRQQQDAASGAQLELEFALQRLEPAQSVLAQITQRLTTMKTEKARPSRVRLSQAARASEEPVAWLPISGLLATIGLALGLPFGLALLWEMSVRRITTVDQLERNRAEIGVIGEIAALPASRGGRITATPSQRVAELGLFEESIDSLRTSLILADDDQAVQILAVASAVSGEGKTSVSSQLAVSLARATGKPTLLIDGDMRSPDIHNIFQISRLPGLAEVLSGRCRLDEAINRSWSDAVHLLPAGDLHCNPHKLLGTASFHELLEEARLWYRYIVIDTPPVLAASESLVMAREADGVLLCAMRDVSRENHLRLAYRRLIQTGARPLGKVLSGVPVREYAYRYGTYGYAQRNS
jgi:capsular exopolysaccharide synthesis family protein